MGNTAIIIGQRIQHYRQQLKLTQEDLAELADCHRTYIGQIERGEKNATIESIEKIASALNITLSQLFEKLDGRDNIATNYPLLCYELVAAQDINEQKRLYRILKEINDL